ncbi:MAG: hypothetical protein N3A54_02920 [Patescibacteria group bacterium]|nr:hypothetical protein [Patescibacteria group bacterium]
MNPFLLIVSIVIFVSGVIIGRQSQPITSEFHNDQERNSPTIQEKQTEEIPQQAPTEILKTPTKTLTNTPAPTKIPTHPQTPTPISNHQQNIKSIKEFYYPNSSIVSETQEIAILHSNDSPETISIWYERQIDQLGYSSTAKAKTNTNGNIINKLGAGKNGHNVVVEITKKADESTTQIMIKKFLGNDSGLRIEIQNNQSNF